MDFTLSTKPLANALDLAVPNDVSSYDMISRLAKISVSNDNLSINFQSNGILSELLFKGKPSNMNMDCTIFVNNAVLKQLISSFDSNSIKLEFESGGLKVKSGNSSFLLPQLLDSDEIEMKRPDQSKYTSELSNLDTESWKYIKANQSHFISLSHEYPVYTMIYVNEDGDVLAGDIGESLFSHSSKNDLGQTCLIAPVIAELFASIPDNATFKRNDTNYLIEVEGDGYKYIAEIFPKHENDSDMGDYNHEIIMGELVHPNSYITVNPNSIHKLINQAALLVALNDDVMDINIESDTLNFSNNSINCDIIGESFGNAVVQSKCKLPTKNLKSALKSFSGDKLNVAMLIDDDNDPKGMLFFDDDVTVVVGALE